MKGFFIEVSNDLLDPKHCEQMGEAVWLFMWLLDKITAVASESGKVLGGKPIKYKEVEADLGISRSTYNRWMKALKDGGYVKSIRTPYGSCIVVLKAKKRFSKKATDVPETKHVIRSIKTDTSIAPSMTHQSSNNDTSIAPSMTRQSSELESSNKTLAVDISSIDDKSVDDNLNIISPSGSNGDGLVNDSITIKNGKNTKITGKLVNDTIALFLPIMPGDFVGQSSAFAKQPTRDAVINLLERYTLDEIKNLIKKYDAGKTDPYRPQAGTVYEFCTFKLAKIEAFVTKTAGALWAHRSISTPEQREDSDNQLNKIIEARREKQRKNREQWEKDHPKQQ